MAQQDKIVRVQRMVWAWKQPISEGYRMSLLKLRRKLADCPPLGGSMRPGSGVQLTNC